MILLVIFAFWSVLVSSKLYGGILATCGSIVTFPDNDGHVVAAEALSGCSALTEVTMNSNIQYIGSNAFYSCNKLKTITWPNELREIGQRAFEGCSSLTELIFPSKLATIDVYAFRECPKLTKVVFPESLVTCSAVFYDSPSLKMSVANSGGHARFQARNDYYLFMDNYTTLVYVTPTTSIISLDLPEETVQINGYALVYYKGTSLVIPDSIQQISSFAFTLSNIRTLTFGAGVKSFADQVFLGATSLEELIVDSRNDFFASLESVIYSKDMSVLHACPYAKSGTLILPLNVADFGGCPFDYGCRVSRFSFDGGLTSGTHLSVTSDGKSLLGDGGRVLMRCVPYHGADYSVPSSVESIGKFSFTETSIKFVTLPASCTYLGEQAFYESSLTGINIEKVTSCGYGVFLGSKVQSLTIPGALIDIPYRFLSHGGGLKSVSIGTGTRTIGNEAFRYYKPTSITLPETLVSIGSKAFEHSSLSSITFPKCIESIGASAFSASTSLGPSLIIPYNCKSVASRAFSMCSSLLSVTLESCNTDISPDAFLSHEITIECISTTKYFTADVSLISNSKQPLLCTVASFLYIFPP